MNTSHLPDLTHVNATEDQKLAEWVEAQVTRRLSAARKTPESHPDEAKALREVYSQAIVHHVLYGDFELLCEDGLTVTVAEMLDAPDKWHGRRFADPLEQEGNDHRIAWTNLRAVGRPYIHSNAHGGQRFPLIRARRVIEITGGERVDTVKKALELMRLDGSIFERGGELVRVGQDGVIHPMRAQDILFVLDRIARWMKFAKLPKPGAWVPTDAPQSIAEGILASRGDRNLPTLAASISAPTIDLKNMRVIEEDGFDPISGLLLTMPYENAWPGIITNPTREQLQEALNTLWLPFKEFPFCGQVDRGVMLAVILTALVRSSLDAAPATMFDAPSAGSGKSLLSKCVAILTSTLSASILVGVEKDEETRKRLLALGLSGAPVAVLDNLTGTFGSAALCGWLTTEFFTDRVLGVSEQVTVPTNALIILNGNNVVLRGDLCRRVLTCRIDPAVDTPWRRKFDLDPAEHCGKNRLGIVAAGLTLLLAGIGKGETPPDRTASFGLWSDTVRKTVLFVGTEGLLDVVDPTLSIDTAFEEDPDTMKLKALLIAWYAIFGEAPTTVADLISSCTLEGKIVFTDNAKTNTKPDEALDANKNVLADVLREIAMDRKSREINAKRLGQWLKKNKTRRVNGLRIERLGVRGNTAQWQCLADLNKQ